MDTEGQNSSNPVFHSGDIGSQATSEVFSNVTGGKKDKEKVKDRRTRISRRTLFVALGIVCAALIIALSIALIMGLSRPPHGSRTDEEIPTAIEDVEKRVYNTLYSDEEIDYKKAILYLNDLMEDIKDYDRSSGLLFSAYILRVRLVFQGGLRKQAITEALRLLNEADTDYKKYQVYAALYYMYNQQGDEDRRDFYGDLIGELDVDLETKGLGGD